MYVWNDVIFFKIAGRNHIVVSAMKANFFISMKVALWNVGLAFPPPNQTYIKLYKIMFGIFLKLILDIQSNSNWSYYLWFFIL